MSKDYLNRLIDEGHEIEFQFHDKMFSMTYGNHEVISICEFYKEPIEVKTIDELCHVRIEGIQFLHLWENLDDKDLWIY